MHIWDSNLIELQAVFIFCDLAKTISFLNFISTDEHFLVEIQDSIIFFSSFQDSIIFFRRFWGLNFFSSLSGT